MNSTIEWRDIRTPAALAALEPAWWALWRRSTSATPFQSPAWLLPWWEAFAPGDLATVAGWIGTRLVALAPFYLETGARGRRLLPLGISVSDFHDILVEPEDAEAACASLAAHICGSYWDSWILPELPEDAQALRLRAPSGCEMLSERASACPVLVLPSTVDGLPGVIPKRTRQTIQGARNRAARRGEVQIIQADASCVLPILDDLISLHAKRWKTRGESGVFADARVQQFHRAVVPKLLEAGLLRLRALRIEDATAAVVYGFQHRERAYYYLTGFDPAYEFESPGVLLMIHAIKEAVREGAREFHLLRGQEAYKYRWGAEDRWNRSVTFERAGRHARAS